MTYDINELSVLREALNFITIKGSDAQQIASLQVKLEQNISDIKHFKYKKTNTKREPHPSDPFCIYNKLLARKGSGHRTFGVTNRNII